MPATGLNCTCFHATTLVVLTLLVAAGCQGKRPGRSADARPNIVLIYTDDLDCETLFGQWPGQSSDLIQFPTLRELASSGTMFTNFHVTTPVCGPSRACLYSGQYAHHNNYRVNNPDIDLASGFSGGYQEFDPENSLGGWMQAAGFETAQVGKYLHEGYKPDEDKGQTWASLNQPGWNHFLVSMGSKYFDFYRTNGLLADLTHITDRYRTDVEVESIQRIFESRTDRGDDRPLFLCWTPLAPHAPSTTAGMTASRHRDLFEDAEPSGFDQRLQQQREGLARETARIPAATEKLRERASQLHRDRLRSMQALDEGLAKISETLEQLGELDNTLFIFTSDHGFILGDYRHIGKRLPYDRITRVPFFVTGPGVPAGQTCHELLANIDIAPTLLDLAGSTTPESIDGRSFAKLIYDPGEPLQPPRDAILIENWSAIRRQGEIIQSTYVAMRTRDHIYTEWAIGDREYYDIKADPEQLVNLFPSLSAERRGALADQLRDIRQDSIAPRFARLFHMDPLILNNTVSAGFKPETFSGFVEDDRGIDSVQLELYCENIDSYWDGTDWTTQPARVDATLAIPGGNITRWEWSLDTSQVAFGEGKLSRRDTVVNLIATDVDGNETRWDHAQPLKIMVDDPETWIDHPPGRFLSGSPFTVSGRAADNRKLARVEMSVTDLENDLYWDGQEWTDERRLFDVEIVPDPDAGGPGDHYRWSYTFDGPREGRVFICVRAYDDEGNCDTSIPFRIILPTAK
ncbi:MAG: sulfatase family protein [Pirellulaceae bacterium]